MAFVTTKELIDLVVMTAAVGYIFSGIIRMPGMSVDKWKDFLFSTAIAAPAVVFHEAAHKVVATLLGLTATFHAAYKWLVLGIILKHLNFGIFFIPGYVSIGGAEPLQSALSAFAGPFLNLVLALISIAILKYGKGISHRVQVGLLITKKLNLFLFCFNMLPIPPFDGSKVIFGLYQAFFA